MFRGKLILVFFFLSLSNLILYSQERHINGYFPVNNYTNDDFNSPVQIWDGVQVEYGVLLFGNDRKILRFNGSEWTSVPKNPEDTVYTKDQIKDKTVSSIFISEDSTCYVARDNSLGRVHYNDSGKHVYTPFYYDEDLKNIWSIHETDENSIIFVSSKSILKYIPSEDKVQQIPFIMKEFYIQASVDVKNGILIVVKREDEEEIEKKGEKEILFLNFETNEFAPVSFKSETKSYLIRSSYRSNNQHFMCGYLGKIFLYNQDENTLEYQFSLEHLEDSPLKVNWLLEKDGMLWAATENHGVGIYKKNGKLIRLFGDREGLQDLNVFNLFFDKENNLWLNLDNGISSIEFSSPTALWNRMYDLEGAVEAVESIDNDLILATRTGIFKSKRKESRMMIPNSKTIDQSTFDVKVFNTDFGQKTLVVGYNGIYEIDNFDKDAIPLNKDLYGWELMQSPFNKNKVFLGGENFLGSFTIDNDGWSYEEISPMKGDIIKFEEYNDKVYFGVRGDGIYYIDKNDSIKKLLPEANLNIDQSHFYLATFQNKLYAGHSKGFIAVKGDSLVRAKVVNLDFENNELNVHRLYNHPERQELWAFIIDDENSEKRVGYFQNTKDEGLMWADVNIESVERGIVYDIKFIDGIIYFGSTNGLVGFDRKQLENVEKKWNVYINEMNVAGESVMFIPEFSPKLAPIEHGLPIKFSFSSASFFRGGVVEYRSRLIGLSNEWSEYESTNYKVFDQPPSGEYTFEIQGRNFYGIESEVYRFKFTVLPPWYLTWWAYIIYFSTFILIIIVTTRISIYRVKQKNKLLEETVNERTKEIAEQNNVLEKQKNEIIEINEDLLSSIKYAKRIQNTILPSPEILTTYFNDFFVYYLPKDIVSGDFYWARKFDNKIIWSAVDCTGHGVPGAFVSIVGNNALVRSTNEFGLRQPAQILNKLRELVIEAFKAQGTNDVKDGMDLALASLDLNTLELEYAGANNPLIILRNGELIEVKADKQPIGDFEKMEPFTNHKIQLQKGDAIYLFSDGFVDQFGGKDEKMRANGGKKFKSKPFKSLLMEIENLPMKEQKEILRDTFNTWRGDIDQIDDVCIFAVRI